MKFEQDRVIRDKILPLKKPGAWTPKTFTAASLLENPPEPPEWIVPGILPVGLSYLAGRPKAGKSLFAGQIARAVTDDHATLFGLSIRHGPVLYIDVENSKWRLFERFSKGGLLNGPGARRLHFQIEWQPGNRSGLLQLLEEHKPVLVVIDIWAKFRAPRHKDQDQYEFESDELRWLNSTANERGICILGVGHRTKFEDINDPFINFAGSTAITAGVDTMLAFSKVPGSTDLRDLQMRGRDVSDESWILKIDDKLNCEKVCDGEQYVTEDQLRYLQTMGRDVWPQARLAKELGVSQPAVSKVLATLADKRLVSLTIGGTKVTEDGLRLCGL